MPDEPLNAFIKAMESDDWEHVVAGVQLVVKLCRQVKRQSGGSELVGEGMDRMGDALEKLVEGGAYGIAGIIAMTILMRGTEHWGCLMEMHGQFAKHHEQEIAMALLSLRLAIQQWENET